VGNAHGAGLEIGSLLRGDAGQERETALGASVLGFATEWGRGPRGRPDHAQPEPGRECEPADASGGEALGGLGGDAHGVPARVDQARRVPALPDQWPAGRDASQYAWEPPRTITGREPDRRARLRALGNAVVPQVAREVARAVIVPLFLDVKELG
jgi:hypothetical protein